MKLYQAFPVCSVVACALLYTPATLAQKGTPTTLIREMAKNKPRVILAISGPQAEEAAREIQDRIVRHPDIKHKPEEIAILSIDDADREAAPDPKTATTFILLISRKEFSGKLPAQLSAAAALKPEDTAPGTGLIRCQKISDGGRGLAFAVTMVAPDLEHLKQLVDKFSQRSAPDYKSLDFTEQFKVHNVAVFSSPLDREAIQHWGSKVGPGVWSVERWYPLDERDKLAPEELADFNQVYFLNRSRKESVAPKAIGDTLQGIDVRSTTTVAKKSDLGNGCSIAVFSAPNGVVMHAKAMRFNLLETIPSGPVVEDAKDLRKIGRTALVVSGGPNTAADRETIRQAVTKAMRDHLQIPVEERADIYPLLQREVTLQDLQGSSSETADILRRRGGLRYVWQYTVNEYGGGTTYNSGIKLVSEDKPRTYEEAHPNEKKPQPDDGVKEVGGGRKDAIARREPIYKRELREWEDRKRDWEDREARRLSATYERTITSTATARSRGVLRLVDISDPKKAAEVVLETDIRGLASTGATVYKQDTAIVRLGASKPPALEPPANTDTCPAELMRDSAIRGAGKGILNLAEMAWLPDVNAPIEEPVAEKPAEPTPQPEKSKPAEPMPQPAQPMPTKEAPAVVLKAGEVLVAGVADGTLILAGGKNNGLLVGDRVFIALQTNDIKHPTTGKVLKTVVTKSITLKIVKVEEESADCVPVSPAEAAKLMDAKAGMIAKTAHPTPAAPAKKGS